MVVGPLASMGLTDDGLNCLGSQVYMRWGKCLRNVKQADVKLRMMTGVIYRQARPPR